MKKALVTGASEGIGRAFVKQLAQEGFQVTCVSRSETKLKSVIAELKGDHQYLVADLSEPSGVKKVSDLIRKNKFDLLVNNAGVGTHGPFEKTSLETLQSMIRLNCEALVSLSHDYLQNAKSGDALMNVSSTLAFNGFPYSSVYSATKAFVLAFSESLWFEQRNRGVYVTALCPGATDSNFHDAAGFKTRPPKNIMQMPEEVVKEALNALKKRKKPSVISGPKNRAMVFITSRVMSRMRAVSLMGGFGEPKN